MLPYFLHVVRNSTIHIPFVVMMIGHSISFMHDGVDWFASLSQRSSFKLPLWACRSKMSFFATLPTSKIVKFTNLMILIRWLISDCFSHVLTITKSSINSLRSSTVLKIYIHTHVSLVHVATAKLELHLFLQIADFHLLYVSLNKKFGDNLFKGRKLFQSSNDLNNSF